MSNRRLAKIEKASLEIKERGILNFWLNVKYEDGGYQGIGGIALDTYSEKIKSRVGTAYGCEMIRQLLLQFNVNDFSEMRGKHLWVIGDGDGLRFDAKGVQALQVDHETEPLMFSDMVKRFKLDD